MKTTLIADVTPPPKLHCFQMPTDPDQVTSSHPSWLEVILMKNKSEQISLGDYRA